MTTPVNGQDQQFQCSACGAVLVQAELETHLPKCAPEMPPAEWGENPHAVTRFQLERYPERMRPLVLKHGTRLFGLATIVGGSNVAFQPLLATAHNLRHLRRPVEVLMQNMQAMFNELCTLHQWTPQQVVDVVREIGVAESLGNPLDKPSGIIVPTRH